MQLKIQAYEDFDQVQSMQETVREHHNFKQRVLHLEHELSVSQYERDKLQAAFDEMRRKIEERVPAIA